MATTKAYVASRRPAPHLGKALLAAAATHSHLHSTWRREGEGQRGHEVTVVQELLGADEPLSSTLTLRQNPPPTSPIRLELAANFLLRNLSISTSPRTSSYATYLYRLRRERPPTQPIHLEHQQKSL
ncbi:hypothetical protein F5878DRAFT_668013 [Lentinula raphanica]|uniref:Uncharacterized protein n=1 Tax=Lentinula raphanica TaxID=153919 RepID=A0AA38NUY8_9AGAR|nr:hypothetical protein F5878DRAFT_668013 [Lentinula raphanica]